jgi:flagellar transcriptional activator FlhC
MATKSVVTEAKQIQLAVELINLGARLQVLEAETSLSRERLLKLYKEVNGYSPPKGMLPYSTDWFVTWMPNIHASIFMDIHKYLTTHGGARGIEAVIKAYKLYLEHCQVNAMEPVLEFTRAWTLMRFCNSDMLRTAPCRKCGGHFVVHSYDLHRNFVCGLCHVPSRAGKTKKAREEEAAGQELRAA